MGLTYTCDLFHDDQPTPGQDATGTLVSIPYSLEMNDTIAYNVNLVEPRALWRDHQAPVRPALRRGRALRHRDVHPAARLPGRAGPHR
jgi:hypothetical protein